MVLLGGIKPAAAQQMTYSVIHAFPNAESDPLKLSLGNDGALYGTTASGGLYGDGVLFRVNRDGTGYSVLHVFNRSDPQNGASPNIGTLSGCAGLIQGADGALYGTTQVGGASQLGTVFTLNTDGSGFTLLHSFSGQTDGATPYAGLLLGQDGMLYGTTTYGDALGDKDGVVFRMNTDGTNFQVVHHFDRNDPDNGALPFAALIQGSDATLYGTTLIGGPGQNGIIFSMAPDGTNFKVLYGFIETGPYFEGPIPSSGPLLGSDGLLYGTTQTGGMGGGTQDNTVFKLKPDGTGFSTVYTFTTPDGLYPTGGLIEGADAALYGTTRYAGPAQNGWGTVYRVTQDGSNFTVLHAFSETDAATAPESGVVQAADGLLYGSAFGHSSTLGAIFTVNPKDQTFNLIYSFVRTEGDEPAGGVIQGADGSLYGTTLSGGTGAADNGTVFTIKPDGTGFSLLHSFDWLNGAYPIATLIQGSDGTLYGTTVDGGPGNEPYDGTIFKVTPDGKAFQMLHGFTGPDGSMPSSALLLGTDGFLYGTSLAGTTCAGTIFRLTPDGNTFQILHTFLYPVIQANPIGLIWGPGGLLYGTTDYDQNVYAGSVYWMSADGSEFKIIHQFDPTTEGGKSEAPLLLGSDGALYGTTTWGGSSNVGTIFKLQPDGSNFTVLHTFSGGSDGGDPRGGLIQGRDGALYGTAASGGEADAGTVFKVMPDGTGFTVLHSFDPSSGGSSIAPLLQAADGSFYGVALSGGPKGGGVVFRLGQTDSTPPTITITTPANGAAYMLSQSIIASYSCMDASGVASCTGTVPNGSPIDTSSVGTKSFTVTAADIFGNTSSVTVTYSVQYNFGSAGFLPPVQNPPTYNSAKAGATVPVKFSLGGNQGLDIFMSGYPMSQPISCSTGVPYGTAQSTTSPGNSGLQYDPTADQYTYTWKTDKTWAGTCREIILGLKDGSQHYAYFTFK
jgi:uncharacterized repeat protein (TIGR03803 family)